jgi:hypothetical protein
MISLSRLIPGGRGRALRRHFRDRSWLGEADVAFVSFPKSGRTFVRAMLAHLYQKRFGIDERELLEFSTLRQAPPSVPRLLFTHDQDAMRRAGEIRIDETAYAGRKVAFLARHPGDVIISRFHHLKHRSKDPARRRLAEQPLDEFVWTELGGIPAIVAFMNAWAGLAARRGDVLLLRYEDFLAEPAKQLKRLARFVALETVPADIVEAVEFARIDNLKAKERAGFFTSDRLQERDQSDALSGKVRSGKAGGYRTSLTPENVERIDKYVKQHLDPVFGYAAR